MQVGLLWFDNDPQRGIATKIQDAASRYQEKFGRPPDTCYVNSLLFSAGIASLTPQSRADPALRVVPAVNILPHHFWVGEEGERDASGGG